jgi:tetratricopeptide (TPR) repeat protein
MLWTGALLCVLVSCSTGVPAGDAQSPGGVGDSKSSIEAPETLVFELDERADASTFADAQARLAKGEYAQLLEEADAALEANPNSGLAHEIRGAALFGLGRIPDAAAAFRRATEVDTGRSGPWTKLGILQMEGNEIENALTSLQKAVEINPSDRYAHQRLGLLYEYRGDAPKAIAHLQRGLVGAPPDYLGVAVNLGRLLSIQGRYKEAVDALGPRVPTSSGDPLAHLVLASALYSTNQFNEARERYERAAALDSGLLEARVGAAMAHRALGDTTLALKLLDDIVRDRPDWPVAMAERGATLMTMGRFAEASSAFDRYLALGGDEKRAKVYKAELARSAKLAQAKDSYAAILKSGKADPETYAKASEVYLAEGDARRGEEVLREGLQRFPDNGFLVMRLGAYLASLTRYKDAIPLLERAQKMTPADPVVLRMLTLARTREGDAAGAVEPASRLYEVTGRPDAGILYASRLEAVNRSNEAAQVYRKVLAEDPENPLALNNLATLLGRSKEFTEAERLARQATTKVPNDGRVLDTLGWILHLQGKRDEAATVLSRAAALAPTVGIVRYHHGVVLESLGRPAEARQAYTEAVRLDEAAAWAKDARSRAATLR